MDKEPKESLSPPSNSFSHMQQNAFYREAYGSDPLNYGKKNGKEE